MAKKDVEYQVTSSGCWVCTSHVRDEKGYIRLRQGNRLRHAHRVVFEDTYGPVPSGMDVCHSCDNPPCINPEHLFIGTRRDNVQDCIRKGRFRKPTERTAFGLALRS